MLVKCLYCDVDNDARATGGYCEACGKKLPPTAMLRPRRTIDGLQTSTDGPAPPLPRRAATVCEALIVASVVHLVFGGVFLILGAFLYREVPARFGPIVLTWTILPTLIVGGLAFLARYLPEASTVIGLGLFVGWVGVSFLLYPELAAGWLIVQFALLVCLAWAAWQAIRPERSRTTA